MQELCDWVETTLGTQSSATNRNELKEQVELSQELISQLRIWK